MARANVRAFVRQCVAAVLVGGLLGGVVSFASAQDADFGWLNEDCAKTCVAKGYDAEFCGQVCWVPDPAKSAEADNIDWKCIAGCRERGGGTRTCLASCRRH